MSTPIDAIYMAAVIDASIKREVFYYFIYFEGYLRVAEELKSHLLSSMLSRIHNLSSIIQTMMIPNLLLTNLGSTPM
ncbi:MAG TPA: hypothetical protein VFJ51_09385 [Nitrososphaeraceae archaeon]|nr:hypothetical protein [Nitrososphaeraceae archaeon]